MSIATKRGDGGETDLLYGRRVSKSDARVWANSKLDELNARLGWARAVIQPNDAATAEWIRSVQNHLFSAMGEIAVHPDDIPRHDASKMPRLEESFLTEIESRLAEREPTAGRVKSWSVPGESPASAALHLARTACREAEVSVVRLQESGLLNPAKAPLLLRVLNRLSDLLWVEARLAE